MATQKKQSKEREYVVDLEEGSGGATRTLVYAVGALGGLALGALLVRGFEGAAGRGAAERIRGAARERFSPGRLRRSARETDELVGLEDRVLDAFLADAVLSGEALDIGAVAPGIVELSGVASGREAVRLALAVAQRVDGVTTVLNRMEVEGGPGLHALDTEDEDAHRGNGAEWSGMRSGMGSRRQGRETDPARSDDSHHQREVAIEKADRAQFEDEGYHPRPRMAARGGATGGPRGYDEKDLDNQSPYGKHATPAPPPREAQNSGARVGEGLKPGTELRLESADLPLKPHQRARGGEHRGA
jgi:hypothetical protein